LVKIHVKKDHPVFNDLDDIHFLCLNVDEITEKTDKAEILATNPDCKFQVLQYCENILTFQSHPEIFKKERLEAIKKHRKSLLDHCPDLDDLVEQTKNFADDTKNKIFMENLVEWLLS
jgi:GMP synthase-like glutamine amidotransferase